MLWAEHVARNTAGSRDDVFAEVRRHFNDTELVELTGVCGLFAQSNRFQDSLKLPIEPPREVDKIRSSVRVDAARLKAYVARLVDTWPAGFPSPKDSFAPHGRATAPAAQVANLAPRVPLPDPEAANGDVAWFLLEARRLLGAVPNWVRLWAHVPHLGKLLLPLPLALTHDGIGAALPASLRAMVLLATSRENAALYSLAHHLAMARAAGLSAEQQVALESGAVAASPAFDARERAAVAWAEHVARNTAKSHDEVFEELRTHFDEAAAVELTALCTVSTKMDRIHNALRLPLEDEAEFAALHRSERIDPERLRNYLRAVVDAWPQSLH